MEQDFKLGNNGDQDPEALDESEDQLQTAFKNLKDLKRDDGVLVSLTKQDLSLLKTMIHAPDKSDDFSRISMICDFLDEEDARRSRDPARPYPIDAHRSRCRYVRNGPPPPRQWTA